MIFGIGRIVLELADFCRYRRFAGDVNYVNAMLLIMIDERAICANVRR